MGIVEELAKLQQLKLDGVLTDEEFAAAKRKLLAESAAATPAQAPPPVDLKLDLSEEFNDIVDDKSTLGGAANRYVDYKFASMIIGAIIFIIMLIFMATMFNHAQNSFNNFPGHDPFFGR